MFISVQQYVGLKLLDYFKACKAYGKVDGNDFVNNEKAHGIMSMIYQSVIILRPK